MTMESKQAIHHISLLFSCYYVHYITDIIKTLELGLCLVLILLKGCVCYICASLFFTSKGKHLSN